MHTHARGGGARRRSVSLAILALASISIVVGVVAWWVGEDPDVQSTTPSSLPAPEISERIEPSLAADRKSQAVPELVEPAAQPVESLAPLDENNSLRGSRRVLATWGRERTDGDRAPCTLVVIDWEDRPVAGALVRVVGDQYQRQSSIDFPAKLPPTIEPVESVTDAAGRCTVQPPEYSPRVLVEKSGVGQSGWVHLAPGDGHDEYREILVPLRPGARLTGCVVQADGSPAPGTAVRVGTFGDPVVDVELTADGRGRFETPVPSLEDVAVRVEVPGEKTRWHHLRIQPGETGDVRLRLPGHYAIRGQVLDADGQPYSRDRALWVRFWPDPELASDAEGVGGPVYAPSERVGDDGRFEFVLDRPIRGMLTASGGIPGLIETPVVAIDAGHPRAEVELRIIEGTTITGRVLDEAGAPLAGVELTATALEVGRPAAKTSPSRSQLFGGAQAKTTSSGEFVLEGLHPQAAYTVWARDRTAGRVLVVRDVEAGTRDLVLACGTAAERSGSITLVVTAGDTGRRAARYRVQVCSSSTGGMVAGEESDDGSGLATIDRLEVGAAYDLIVSAKGLACQYLPGVVAAEESTAIKLTLPVLASLSIDARRGGVAVPWPVVIAERDASAAEQRVHRDVKRAERGDESGLVELKDLDPGRYSLRISQGGRRSSAQVTLAPGETRRLVIELD